MKEPIVEHESAYRQKMAAQLKEWDAQINLLEAKIENLGAGIKLDGVEEVRLLRARQRAAAEKMRELGKSSGIVWEQIKLTADKVWDDLKTGLGEAQARFK